MTSWVLMTFESSIFAPAKPMIATATARTGPGMACTTVNTAPRIDTNPVTMGAKYAPADVPNARNCFQSIRS